MHICGRVSPGGGISPCQGPEAGMARGWNRGSNGMVGDAKVSLGPSSVGLCGPYVRTSDSARNGNIGAF